MAAPSPTIRSLAALAGVSAATVSLALRNSPRIGRATTDKIHRLAQESGYKGSPIVSRLLSEYRSKRGGARQGNLAIIHTSPDPQDHKNRTVREWVASAKDRASGAAFGCDEFSLHTGETGIGRILSIMRARGTSGILLTGPFAEGKIPASIWNRISAIPTIVMGERPVLPTLSCALNDQFATSRRASIELSNLGYRRLGLCLHPDIDSILERRFGAGFLTANPRHLPQFDLRPDSRRDFLRWFRRYKPDAILTMHVEIRAWLESVGVNCPGDIGLAHLDLPPTGREWSGMRQDNSHLGGSAVDLLLSQIHFHISGTPPFQQCLMLGSEWIDGWTTRKINC